MNYENYVSVDDVARLLGLNKYTVYKMANQGRLPSYKFGKVRRFKMSEVEAYVEREGNCLEK